jgi:3-phenylpropionate/trans-cinnamate dioxygenase ferredoxin subunit
MTTLNLDELTQGKPKRIEVDGESVCVARIGDEVFAISDTCSHSDASLSEGDVTGYRIECWLHGAEFDLRTGAALTPPAVEAVASYEVIQEGTSVTIQSKK